MKAHALALVLALGALGCGASAPPTTTEGTASMPPHATETSAPTKQAPPASGPARDVRLPTIVRSTTPSGLEVNVVRHAALPVVSVRLVVRSGGASDPTGMPGVAHLVAQMLREGTRTKSSAALAEAFEFLGADLNTGSDEESVQLVAQGLSEHFESLLTLLADVAQNPSFDAGELEKLKARERDRLALQADDPNFLATRELYRAAYGDHPYAHVDTTPEVVARVTRADLQRWHRAHFAPNNAFLVVVGDVDPAAAQALAARVFGAWRSRDITEPTYPPVPTSEMRRVILVDRPASTQSVIAIGNPAVRRNDPTYLPLLVANQVLGGSAAARLFMDLRERRSLTYGAYSSIDESVDVGLFRARASVRNEVTADAMAAFFEHLERIAREAPPTDELANAARYLSDRFPLQIDSAGKIGGLVANLRMFSLPDDYWDGFRSAIRGVSAEQALEAARTFIRAERAWVVVVGRAEDVAEPLRRYGDVRVVDTEGRELRVLSANAAPSAAR